MRILFITSYSGLYGANRSLYELIVDLIKEGIESTVLISGPIGELGKKLKTIGVSCIEAPFSPIVIRSDSHLFCLRKLSRRIMRYKGYRKALKMIRRMQLSFDVIHSNTIIAEIGYYLSQKMNIPHVWHIREFPREGYGLVNVLTRREMRNRMMRSQMVAISQAVKEKYMEEFGVKSIKVVYNRISICPPYEKTYFCEEVLRFASVGEICKNKRQLDIVKACVGLKSRGISGFQLFIVGNGEERVVNEIKECVSMNGLESIVHFVGYKNDVNEVLANCDVGILASESEGFGRVLVEYMANYMLPIGTNTGGIPEAISGNGLLYEVGDIESLADIMGRCVLDRQMVVRSKCRVRECAEEYDTQRCAKQLIEIYKQIANKSGVALNADVC